MVTLFRVFLAYLLAIRVFATFAKLVCDCVLVISDTVSGNVTGIVASISHFWMFVKSQYFFGSICGVFVQGVRCRMMN